MRLFEEISGHDALLLIEASKKGMHRTLSGRFVKLGSEECRRDIEKRIADMSHHRDESGAGTDSRSYYSGVLRVLRRKLRENDRIMLSLENQKQKTKKDARLTESTNEDMASRILLLAGLL